jgi:hypothetical protein
MEGKSGAIVQAAYAEGPGGLIGAPGKFGPTICGLFGFWIDENGNCPLSSWGGLEGGLWVTGCPPKVLLQSWLGKISAC